MTGTRLQPTRSLRAPSPTPAGHSAHWACPRPGPPSPILHLRRTQRPLGLVQGLGLWCMGPFQVTEPREAATPYGPGYGPQLHTGRARWSRPPFPEAEVRPVHGQHTAPRPLDPDPPPPPPRQPPSLFPAGASQGLGLGQGQRWPEVEGAPQGPGEAQSPPRLTAEVPAVWPWFASIATSLRQIRAFVHQVSLRA